MKIPNENQKNIKKKEQQPLSEINENVIKENFPVNQIIDDYNGKPIPCPKCSKTDFLRGWEIKGEMFTLCYFCGSFFSMETGEILYTCEGDRIGWGASALAIIGSKKQHINKSKSNNQ